MKTVQGTNIPPYPHIDGKHIKFPCYAEVKIDGEANIYAKGVLISKASGKIRTDFPITTTLKQIVDDDTILFGELHWDDGKAGALYDFLSHAKDDGLNFTIFDVSHPTLIDKGYEDRREWIISNILNNDIWKAQALRAKGSIRVTRPIYLENEAELAKVVEENKTNQWEGVVIKARNSILHHSGGMSSSQPQWVKLKHKETGDYEVMGIDPVLERMDVAVPHIHTNPDGSKGTFRLCGVKLVLKYKPFVKVGDVVEIEHMGVLAQGGLRHPTYRGKIVNGGGNDTKHTAT